MARLHILIVCWRQAVRPGEAAKTEPVKVELQAQTVPASAFQQAEAGPRAPA